RNAGPIAVVDDARDGPIRRLRRGGEARCLLEVATEIVDAASGGTSDAVQGDTLRAAGVLDADLIATRNQDVHRLCRTGAAVRNEHAVVGGLTFCSASDNSSRAALAAGAVAARRATTRAVPAGLVAARVSDTAAGRAPTGARLG